MTRVFDMRRYRYVHILAALFLIVGMAVQFVVSYHQARRYMQENIDLKTQIAHEKILFELYDAYEVVDQLEQFVMDNLSRPNRMIKETSDILERYPSFFSCYVSFRPYYYPEEGKWFSPCSFRLNDTIKNVMLGRSYVDYFEREWYKGALVSGKSGYWSKPYWSDTFNETIFTHSNNLVDNEGKLICVIGTDFSVSWMQRLLEDYKPFDDAICVIYSSDGTVLTASDNLSGRNPLNLSGDSWILSRQTFEKTNIEMMIAVPNSYIWKGILWRILWPFIVFVLGLLVVGTLIRRMVRDQQNNDRLETEKQLLSHELHIAHGIQMGILRKDFPQDDAITVHADLLPMREVGGDLYDFHRQDDFLWFIVGDVSGKGVPAAMFMSATVNLFRSALGHQSSPKAIMEELNAVLSDNNPSLTFVTAFIGRLHVPSGQLLYCNAAHVPPLVQSIEHNVRCIEMVPNLPLGYNGKFQFVEQGCMIGEGEQLVLYTDGVTEARNASRQLMGEPEWMNIVAHSSDFLGSVKRYIGDAEPTDDITIMTICKKSAVGPLSLSVPNQKEHWPLLRRTLHDYGVCIGMEARMLKKLEVAVEEAVVNVLNYSHATELELKLEHSTMNNQESSTAESNDERSMFSVTITDDGVPFDPTSKESDTEKAINERQIGGLGISLIRQIVDELHYQRTNDRNQLIITKYYYYAN